MGDVIKGWLFFVFFFCHVGSLLLRGRLIPAASLAAEHGLEACGWSLCAQLLRGMWHPPRPGMAPCPLRGQADSYPLRLQESPSQGSLTRSPQCSLDSPEGTVGGRVDTKSGFQREGAATTQKTGWPLKPHVRNNLLGPECCQQKAVFWVTPTCRV